jgi:hypothetical protein
MRKSGLNGGDLEISKYIGRVRILPSIVSIKYSLSCVLPSQGSMVG